MTELMRIRCIDTRRFLDAAAVVVAPAAWVVRLLVANGVSRGKIVLSPQGVDDDAVPSAGDDATPGEGSGVRAIILARPDPAKGVHVVLEALASTPTLPIRLDVYGAGEGSEDYAARLRRTAAADSRVRLLPAVPRGEVRATIRRYDVMLVPSQGLETGPLVVLEARAARVPVVGSALSAISDHVHDDVDGALVEPGSPPAWAAALTRLAADPAVLARWRAAIPAPRTMSRVAEEMATLYEGLLAPRAAPKVS
jgi:glycosyltransferase involved in cell wall biosynthesis